MSDMRIIIAAGAASAAAHIGGDVRGGRRGIDHAL